MKTLVSLLIAVLALPAFAGFQNLKCEAYRISQDANRNVQTFTLDAHEVSINGVEMDWDNLVDGDLMFLDPIFSANATYRSDAGKEFNITIMFWGEINAFLGNANVGRDHEVRQTKVKIEVSTSEKKHVFDGVCTEELVTTCGGACADEDENRDVL